VPAIEAELLEFGSCRCDAIGEKVGDHHLRARFGQGLRAGEADALAAAGHDSDAASELELLEIHGTSLQLAR
jgi:hypothetical protein